MKKILSLVFSFFFLVNLIVAQPGNIDSLKHEINIASNDTIKRVKEMIHNRENILPDQQQLFFINVDIVQANK